MSINYSLSKEVQAAVEAHDSECYANAWRGALYLLDSGCDDVAYVVGMYTTPHITTPLYHCWIVCDNQIVDPTTVISYDEDESDMIEYQRIKVYSSDYIIDYEKALDGSPFIDIERPITPNEFDDFEKSELKSVLREVMNNVNKATVAKKETANMKYYKSYSKTNEESPLRNPDLAEWLSDSRDVLQQISNQGGSREGILPIILAIWGACDGFNARYPDASDDGMWLGEIAESLGQLVSLCSMDSVGDDALFTECGNIAYDFQEAIDAIEDNMDDIAEQPVVTVTIADKSYGGARVKLTAGDIAQWIKEKIPGTDARQQKQLTKQMEGELENVFKEFLKLMDWWQKIASDYGALAGEVDDFTAEFQQGLQRVAPTIYQQYWSDSGGFEDWFMQKVNPFLEQIRPYNYTQAKKPFDSVTQQLEEMAKLFADMAKIDLNSLIPEGYLDDAPDSVPEWQAAASIQRRKSMKSNNDFLDWLNQARSLINTVQHSTPTFVNQSAIELNKIDRQAEKWADDDYVTSNYSDFDSIVESLKKVTDIAFDIDTNNFITNSSLSFGRACDDALKQLDEIISSEKQVKSKSVRRFKASDDTEFKNWCNNTAGLFQDYRNASSLEVKGYAKDIQKIADAANKFADDDRIQQMYSFSDMADTMGVIAQQAAKITASNITDFKLNCNEMSQGLYSIADKEEDYLNPEKSGNTKE